jgi:DNA repair protein RadC
VELSDPCADRVRHLAAAPRSAENEQLLTDLLLAVDRRAASGWARRLIDEFGSLKAVLAAPAADQTRVLGAGSPAIAQLCSVRTAMLHVLKAEAMTGPILSDSQALIDYLGADMGCAREERFRVLFLNSNNMLLRDETIEGSVAEAPVYPSEIIRRALEVGATALILVHNHPSGDPEPSTGDINATADIVMAANVFGIRIHDHLVVTRSGTTSFKERGFL